MKVCFETYGCRLNKAEALQMEADYLAAGWETTTVHKDADLIVVRGCSITQRAQSDCENLIAHLKKHYPNTAVHVCGCLRAKNHHPPLPAMLKMKADDALPDRTARAYLKVQDGCAGKCAFCIVPSFRGQSVSVAFDAVLGKAKRFIEAGYHEIVVTGCNLALYSSRGKRLPELLTALAGLDAGCRVRLGSVEPGDCAREVVHAMAETPNICRFLHLPIQSGSNRILRAMRRPYLMRDVDELVTEATKLMPVLGLGCDVMTGFPDETDLDFMSTMGLLKRHPFTNAHVFPFSGRPGTPAVTFPNSVPKPIRSRRAHEVSRFMTVQREKFARTFLGETVEVVIEDMVKGKGWTGEYFRCHVKNALLPRKSIVRARVTQVKSDLLYAAVR